MAAYGYAHYQKLRNRLETRIADDPLAAAETIVDVIEKLRFVETRIAELDNSPTSLGYVREAIEKLKKL